MNVLCNHSLAHRRHSHPPDLEAILHHGETAHDAAILSWLPDSDGRDVLCRLERVERVERVDPGRGRTGTSADAVVAAAAAAAAGGCEWCGCTGHGRRGVRGKGHTQRRRWGWKRSREGGREGGLDLLDCGGGVGDGGTVATVALAVAFGLGLGAFLGVDDKLGDDVEPVWSANPYDKRSLGVALQAKGGEEVTTSR